MEVGAAVARQSVDGAVEAALLAALRMLRWLDPALVKPVLALALTSQNQAGVATR